MVYTGDRKREYQLAWIKARRDAWVTENGPCNWCGSNEDLEVDHIDRYIKDVPVTQVWSLSPHNPKRVKELEKCQVLCKQCHKLKNNGESLTGTHGSETSYRNKCRCRPCTSAHVERIYDQRRRGIKT